MVLLLVVNSILCRRDEWPAYVDTCHRGGTVSIMDIEGKTFLICSRGDF